MTELKNTSEDEIAARIAELRDARDKAREDLKVLIVELDRRQAIVDAKAKAATLSDAEKKALVQIINAEGVKSEEKVGE